MRILEISRLRIAVVTCALAALSAGCVPVPYRPDSKVVSTPEALDGADDMVLSAGQPAWLGAMAQSIAHREPRVVLVNAGSFLGAACPGSDASLSQLLLQDRAGREDLPADFVLILGEPSDEKIDQRGVAAGAFIGVVGYERRRYVERVPAVLIALHDERAPEAFSVEVRYSEVAAGMFYGVATIPLANSSMRHGLADEVVGLMAKSRPSGPLRLAVVEEVSRVPL